MSTETEVSEIAQRPLNGCSYTRSELDADPILKQRILAERRAVWDSRTIKPKAQHTDSSDNSGQKSEVPTS